MLSLKIAQSQTRTQSWTRRQWTWTWQMLDSRVESSIAGIRPHVPLPQLDFFGILLCIWAYCIRKMMLTSNKVVQNMRLSRIPCVTSMNERTETLGPDNGNKIDQNTHLTF